MNLHDSGMKVLPRYRTWESGVGCADHADPTCLCDVVIRESAPVLTTEHKFHKLALHELDDDTVSERNIYEFFSIVMGLHKLERSLVTANKKVLGRSAFKMLPEHVQDAIQNHAKTDSPKHIMLLELEGLGLTNKQISDVAAAYAQLAGQLRARDRVQGDRPLPEFQEETKDQRKQRLHMERMKSDPEYAARRKAVQAENAARRARERASQAKRGKSWLEAKHTGPTLVPGTYALEET